MTVVAFSLAIAWRASPLVTWSTFASLLATLVGFVGTTRALPETHLLATLLERFARWGLLALFAGTFACRAAYASMNPPYRDSPPPRREDQRDHAEKH